MPAQQEPNSQPAVPEELRCGPISSPAGHSLKEIFDRCALSPVSQPRQENIFCARCPTKPYCSRYFN